MADTLLSAPIILSLVELRINYASSPQCGFDTRKLARPCMTEYPGLIERGCGKAWLTSDGWELADRMLAAADDQLTLWQREQAGTLTPEQAERRHVA